MGEDSDMNQAWDIYYVAFRRINKQLPGLSQLELPFVSPSLQEARNLDLAVSRLCVCVCVSAFFLQCCSCIYSCSGGGSCGGA
jgi:hypothetical protein